MKRVNSYDSDDADFETYDKQPQKPLKKRRSATPYVLAIIVVLLLTILIWALFFRENGLFNKTDGEEVTLFNDTGVNVVYGVDTSSFFHTHKSVNGFFFVTKDGIRFRNFSGQELMSDTFSMLSPIIVAEGGIVAIGEKNGNNIYVYDNEKRLFMLEVDSAILHFSINKIGYVSVITKKTDHYGFYVFDNNGIKKYNSDLQSKNIIPVAADVSDDGRIAALATLNTNNIDMSSKITFMYINKLEKIEFADGIYGSSETMENQLIGKLSFMDNNVLISVSDSEISAYDADNKINKRWTMALENQLDDIVFDESGMFAVALGKGIINMEAKKPGLVRWYDLNMTMLGELQLWESATSLSFSNDNILIGSNRKYYSLDKSGKVIWEYEALQDVEKMIYAGSPNKFMQIGADSAKIFEVTKGKQMPETNVTPAPMSTATPTAEIVSEVPSEQNEATASPSEEILQESSSPEVTTEPASEESEMSENE